MPRKKTKSMDNKLHSPTLVTCPTNLTRLHPQIHTPADQLHHQNCFYTTKITTIMKIMMMMMMNN
jgi:hypothetical protein